MDRRFTPRLNTSQTWIYRLASGLAAAALLLAGAAGPGVRPILAQAGGSGSFTQTTAAEFGAGCAVRAGVSVTNAAGGEVRLAATLEDEFDGAAVDTTRWITGTVFDWYTAPITVSNGLVSLNSNHMRSQVNFQGLQPRFYEARVLQRVNGAPPANTVIGFARETRPGVPITDTSASRMFITPSDSNMYMRWRDGNPAPAPADLDVAPDPNLNQYHTFRLEWAASQTLFYIDGVLTGTLNTGIATLNTWAWLYAQDPDVEMSVDWVRAGQYSLAGTYESCALDAGSSVDWSQVSWQGGTPVGTNVAVSTRTSLDGVVWSEWLAAPAGVIGSPDGRYLQYRLELSTTDLLQSPEVGDVTVSYGGPTPTPSATPESTSTITNTPTATTPPTNTPTGTLTPTAGPTNTPTDTPTATATSTTTSTPTATETAGPPTATPTTSALSGTLSQTSSNEFGAVCAVQTGITVSDANGGEIRLAALLEDYFNGTSIDTTRWLTGTTYTWYTVPPTVSGGQLTLDSAYLRSQANFQSVVPRFFEARALQRVNGGNAAWPDLGFYREQPPLYYGSGPYPSDSALRIFVTRDLNTTFARARDGDGTQPLTDIDVPTLDLTQYHLFRIEWDATETRFYTDGALQAAIPGIATLNTWAFLYSQDPATDGRSPMLVDWVRVGQYGSNGTYQSCTLDAGAVVDWAQAGWAGVAPGGTGVALSTRSSMDGLVWSAWDAVVNNSVISPNGRYIQYRLNLTTGNGLQSPEIRDVLVTFGPNAPPLNTPTPTPVPTSTNTPLPTNTLTPTPTQTLAPGVTPSATATPLPGANGGVQFDGTNDVVRAGAIPGTGPFTVEAWVRPGVANENGIVMANGNDLTGWSLELEAGRVTLWVSTNQGWQSNQHGTVLASGQWYHIAATYGSGSIRTYVNGVASTATSAGTLTQGPSVTMGGLAGYPYYNGAVDEVRVSNVVRYTGTFTPPGTFGNDGNTLALWRFDELAGQTAADASASGNTATLGTAAGADSADPLWIGVTR